MLVKILADDKENKFNLTSRDIIKIHEINIIYINNLLVLEHTLKMIKILLTNYV